MSEVVPKDHADRAEFTGRRIGRDELWSVSMAGGKSVLYRCKPKEGTVFETRPAGEIAKDGGEIGEYRYAPGVKPATIGWSD